MDTAPEEIPAEALVKRCQPERLGFASTDVIHLTQEVQVAQQSLHRYIGAIAAGQEEERQRLARELHDDTLQYLIALKQCVQLARLTLQEQPEGELLVELEGLAEQTIDNLRRLTRALRPIYREELGLGIALEMLAREANQTGGVSIYFQRQLYKQHFPDYPAHVF